LTKIVVHPNLLPPSISDLGLSPIIYELVILIPNYFS
jgi:hypothetical protein